MIKYLGSKRTLVPTIVDLATRLPRHATVCDIFSGTTRVAQGFKAAGATVHANDLAGYSQVLADTYVVADLETLDIARIKEMLEHLASLPGTHGFVTENYCVQARYFQPHNGRRIDVIRAEIDEIVSSELERSILLTSLIEAADRVDSTTGLQMAYLKQWAKRSYNDLELRLPKMHAGTGSSSKLDANEYATMMAPVDICYIDPPYNQHSYYSNYHIWETIIRGDTPEVYGVARKRIDCRTTKSDYNSKRRAWDAFTNLIAAIDAEHVIVSFNNEGYFAHDDIVELLHSRGDVVAFPVDFKRYVGAQIGVHSPSGERVGEVSHVRNIEYLFVAGDHAAETFVNPALTGGLMPVQVA